MSDLNLNRNAKMCLLSRAIASLAIQKSQNWFHCRGLSEGKSEILVYTVFKIVYVHILKNPHHKANLAILAMPIKGLYKKGRSGILTDSHITHIHSYTNL